jgi:hypothetical protein
VADQIYDEGLTKLVADPLVGQQIPDIEEIARMLPVEGRHDLSRI